MEKAGEQITLKKGLAPGTLPPGKYSINIKVNDNIARQAITASTPLVIELAAKI